MADGLLNKASIILTPTGYKAGTLYNVAPVVEPYEDFDFARASVASRVNSSGLVEMVGRTLGSELVLNGDFEELGDDLVTNGGFSNSTTDWTNASSDTFEVVDGGVGHSTSLHIEVSAINRGAYQSVFDADKTYYVSLDLKVVSGSIYIGKNTRKLNNQNYNNSDWQTITGYLTAIDDKIRIYGDEASEFYVDNISVKQVDPNDRWNLGTGWSIEDGKLVASSSSNGNDARQLNLLEQSRDYKLYIDISKTSGTDVKLKIYNGSSFVTIAELDESSTVNFSTSATNNGTLYVVSNAFVGTIDNVSVKEIIDTNNIPRISYDSNGANGHILLEPTSTNLFEYSESFNTTEWNKTNITVVDNSSQSPDGTNSASLIYPSSSGDFRYLHNSTIASSSKYTISAFVKASGKNVVWMYINSSSQNGLIYYDLSDQTTQVVSGSVGTPTATIESYNNDWYKISYTLGTGVILNGGSGLGVSDAKGDAAVTVNGTDGVLVWGLQLEALSYATSYIPTLTGSQEIRATETANGAGSADLINSTEGVLYAEIAALANSGDFRMIGISDGTENNVVNFYYRTDANKITVRLKSGGSQVIFESFDITATNFSKVAFRYKSGESNLFIDGVKQKASDYTTTNMPSGLNELAFDSGGGGQFFYGKCKALAVFNEALSDSELNNLTG